MTKIQFPASKEDEQKHKRRIQRLLDTYFEDQDGSDCDIGYLVRQTYIIGYNDCERRKNCQ